jgi:hypothetical protein
MNAEHEEHGGSNSRVPGAYGRLLQWVVVIGIILLVITYALYLGGILPAAIEPAATAEHWHLDTAEYIEGTGAVGGWEWIGLLAHGDYLCFGIIALLSGATIAAMAVALVLYLRERDYWYALITGLTVAVLLAAASGVSS